MTPLERERLRIQARELRERQRVQDLHNYIALVFAVLILGGLGVLVFVLSILTEPII